MTRADDSGELHDARTLAVLGALQDGLRLVPRPYAELAARAGVGEDEARRIIGGLLDSGVIKRLGVVVRHHEFGFVANAMVVFDIADLEVERIGTLLAAQAGVTLCYRRRRHRPDWPYNLFCMVHGRDRAEVLVQVERLREAVPGLAAFPFAVLFSSERFKQCGARSVARAAVMEHAGG